MSQRRMDGIRLVYGFQEANQSLEIVSRALINEVVNSLPDEETMLRSTLAEWLKEERSISLSELEEAARELARFAHSASHRTIRWLNRNENLIEPEVENAVAMSSAIPLALALQRLIVLYNPLKTQIRSFERNG
ncbi:MAG: hypothetical protein NT023_02920 [Armatimonadetes bacterium]|nr:hypothetical protein [Armatimonadota bacterium]